MIFGRKKKKHDDVPPEDEQEEEELEQILFQGAVNGVEANLKDNAKLVQAGLMSAKDVVSDAVDRRAAPVRRVACQHPTPLQTPPPSAALLPVQ